MFDKMNREIEFHDSTLKEVSIDQSNVIKIMSEIATIITGTLPLVGVAIGAGLQYYFSRASEERKQKDLLRTQAYIDYLSSVSKFAQAAKTNPNERYQLLAEAADAKTRICIYGSEEIIGLLANFERQGANLSTNESMQTFMSICSQMRSEGLDSSTSISTDDFEMVLFGPER